jgi:recombination protein RecA
MSNTQVAATAAKETVSKLKTIEALMNSITKEHGEGSVFYSAVDSKKQMAVVSSGSLFLNGILQVGGFPLGRAVEIIGQESSGKTTLALHAIAEAQKQGLVCAFIDVEHALDPSYAAKLGVDMKALIISQPDHGEQALDIFRQMSQSGVVNVIVVDSLAALVPKAELEGTMEKNAIGTQAKLMSHFFRVGIAEMSKNNVLGIFINQLRMKIGVMFGSPITTPAGEAMKYYATIRLSVYPSKKFEHEGKVIGYNMLVTAIKNKVGIPFKKCSIPILYGKGVDKIGETYVLARASGVLEGGAGSHSYKGEKLASKKDDMITLMRTDAKLVEKLRADVDKKLKEGFDFNADPEDSE